MQGDIRPLRQTSRSHAVVRPALKPVERNNTYNPKPTATNSSIRSMEFVQSKPVSNTAMIVNNPIVDRVIAPTAVHLESEPEVKPIARPVVQQASEPVMKPIDQLIERPSEENSGSQQASDEAPDITKTSKNIFGRILSGHRLVYGAAVIVFVAGAGIVLQGLFVNQEVQSQVQALSSSSSNPTGLTQSSNEVPSEEKPQPNVVETYKVAADMPRTISLPSLGVKARVLQVGVDDNNQLLAPKNVFDAAWYTGSSKPGEAGAAVVDGHYSGVSTKGVFGQIKKLKNGDKIDIERGDGKVLSFTIRQVETVAADAVDMGKLLVPVETSLPGLNLITCGGKFDASTHKFSDRTVVYAVLE